MSELRTLSVGAGKEGERLDAFCVSETGLSRNRIQNLCEGGFVRLNGAPALKNIRLRVGDEIEIALPDAAPPDALPQDIPLDIVYEDDCLLVVDKPKGMVVHPAAGNPDNTLVNALLAHCGDSLSGINGVSRPGIVHRIDKDTSGLLIVAKTDAAHRSLAEQIEKHSFERAYEAVVVGHLPAESGRVELAIGRSEADRKKMSVRSRKTREAVTQYRVLQSFPGFDHVRLNLFTGRTHQIRVHMSAIGHPVAGDRVYGGAVKGIRTDTQGQVLHAKKLGFVHPVSLEYMEFESGLPKYFTEFLFEISEGNMSN